MGVFRRIAKALEKANDLKSSELQLRMEEMKNFVVFNNNVAELTDAVKVAVERGDVDVNDVMDRALERTMRTIGLIRSGREVGSDLVSVAASGVGVLETTRDLSEKKTGLVVGGSPVAVTGD